MFQWLPIKLLMQNEPPSSSLTGMIYTPVKHMQILSASNGSVTKYISKQSDKMSSEVAGFQISVCCWYLLVFNGLADSNTCFKTWKNNNKYDMQRYSVMTVKQEETSTATNRKKHQQQRH